MSYQALYRTWRSQTFSDLIGQPHVTQTLRNAILRDRVAHAYLFCGPRGTGKTSAAKILAKAVNCLSPDGAEPCNACTACVSITNGSNVDVEEIDAASNRGVDEIRELRDKVQYAPTSVRKKVYIVDEVHMLTTEAFNALLKTLEEPPTHTLFILATTEPHKIPATIVSRCQRFDFRRIEPELIVSRLRAICESKQWTYDEEALWRIADAADGGLRDALGLLEQTAAFAEGKLTAADAAHVMGGVQTSELLSLVEHLLAADARAVIHQLMTWYAGGKDASRMLHEVLQLVRDLFIVKLSLEAPAHRAEPKFQSVAQQCSEEWLLTAMQRLGDAYVQLRHVEQPRLALETALLALMQRPVSSVSEAQAVPRQAAAAPEPQPTGVSSATVAPAARRTEAGADGGATPPRTAGAVAASVSRRTEPLNGGPRTRAPAKRKLQVLASLHAQRDDTVLDQLRRDWERILQAVRAARITAHAWLTGGEPVLATPDTVVLAFASRIHRDAVMKPDERGVIEDAISAERGHPIQVLALLRADWEAFVEAQGVPAEPSTAPDAGKQLVEQVIALFGREKVEIVDEE
ncbi:MAG: DNA polymerase III subunit gamma/tau [Alicyclobacillus sp.]|nr:DNA polymerase III subunit gamma/tau [Alicyclobacillus sp.]